MLPQIEKINVPSGMRIMENGRLCVDKNSFAYGSLDRAQKNLSEMLIALVADNRDDADLIIKAYQKAARMHGRTLRKSCDSLYIVHPLSAAYSLASLKVPSDIIAAALLHDTVEDCAYTIDAMSRSFHSPIPEIVDAVTKVAQEDDAFFSEAPEDIIKQRREELTQDKLYEAEYWYEALLVKLADREHNLSTISALSSDQARMTAKKTQSSLLASAQKLGIRYYAITLENYCLKILEPNLYADIQSVRDEILRKNGPKMTLFTKNLLQELVDSPFLPSAHRPLSQNQNKSANRTLLVSEIVRQMNGYSLSSCFRKQDVYLEEIVLTYAPEICAQSFSAFFDVYYKRLFPKGVQLRYPDPTLVGATCHLILTDLLENNYSIWLVPQDQIRAFYLGMPIMNMEGTHSRQPEKLSNKMTVYSYNIKRGTKREHRVPLNITALDLAFEFQPKLAKCATKCYIRRDTGFSPNDNALPLSTVLGEGDIVSYIADYSGPNDCQYHVTFDSFLNVTTLRAKAALVDHFKTQFRES